MIHGIRSGSTGEPGPASGTIAGHAARLHPVPPRGGSAVRRFLPRTEDSVQSIRPKAARPRRRWVSPVVTDLPRLTDLTLSTGSPIPGSGDTGGSGSTVTP